MMEMLWPVTIKTNLDLPGEVKTNLDLPVTVKTNLDLPGVYERYRWVLTVKLNSNR